MCSIDSYIQTTFVRTMARTNASIPQNINLNLLHRPQSSSAIWPYIQIDLCISDVFQFWLKAKTVEWGIFYECMNYCLYTFIRIGNSFKQKFRFTTRELKSGENFMNIGSSVALLMMCLHFSFFLLFIYFYVHKSAISIGFEIDWVV